MSFKIFSLQITGKIKQVSAIEQKRKALDHDYKEFQRISASDELKDILKLEEFINSAEFSSKKLEVEGLKFKGSEEDNLLKELEGLKKSSRIRNYFKVVDSSDLKKYESEKDSQRMNDYYILLEYMKEGQFTKDKRDIKSQVFKGSVEERHWLDFCRLEKSSAIRAYKELEGSEKLKRHSAVGESDKLKKYNELKNTTDKEKKKEFKQLKRDTEIKAYFKFEKSKKLKMYHEISGSHDLTRYNELKEYVNTSEFKDRQAFLKDKKKFEKSEAFRKESRFKQLESDSIVKFVLKYGKSAGYKNYLDVKDSFDLKRYNELQEITGSPEFKKRKAWLEDKKRWEKTEEYRKYLQYGQEAKKTDFVLYKKYKDSDAFDFYKNWEIAFEDTFSGNKLDDDKWGTSPVAVKKTIGKNFAMPGDLNLFTDGNNVKLGNKLQIAVNKEKIKGMVWQMPSGFVPAEFDYTSGIVTSEEYFRMEDGILEARIRYNPVKQVVSSFYLAGKETMPRLNLIEMGKRNYLGISTINGNGKVENSGLDISNLKKGDYIFTLEKKGEQFTWKINETEVLVQNNRELDVPLSLNASSLVVDEVPGSQLPVNYEIQWIRCYRTK